MALAIIMVTAAVFILAGVVINFYMDIYGKGK